MEERDRQLFSQEYMTLVQELIARVHLTFPGTLCNSTEFESEDRAKDESAIDQTPILLKDFSIFKIGKVEDGEVVSSQVVRPN